MNIVCPRCETTFSLPDSLYKPGKKARCSQCGNVFPMPGPMPEESSVDPEPGVGETAAPEVPKAKFSLGKYRKAIMGGAAALLVLLLVYGGWLVIGSFFGGKTEQGAETATAPGKMPTLPDASRPTDRQEEYERLINSVSLDEIRQFLVDNLAVGKIMVVQGVAVNISNNSKDYIAIEARILDANNHVLAQHRQLCGVPLTLFQLQTLTADELKEALNNRITILTNNTNIPPGGKVPFVAVFVKPPQAMRTFEVRVIDVRDSPPQ